MRIAISTVIIKGIMKKGIYDASSMKRSVSVIDVVPAAMVFEVVVGTARTVVMHGRTVVAVEAP